jgi:hypothetical protein
MKITILEKRSKTKAVRVLLNDKSPASRIIREDKIESLEIKTPKKD